MADALEDVFFALRSGQQAKVVLSLHIPGGVAPLISLTGVAPSNPHLEFSRQSTSATF